MKANKDKLLVSLVRNLSTPQQTEMGVFTRSIPEMENPADY